MDQIPITIGIPLYPNFDSLDVLGAFQTFSVQPSLKPMLLAETTEPVTSWEGVEITPHDCFDNIKSLDVLFVPGGTHLEEVLGMKAPDDNPLLAFLRRIAAADEAPRLVTSVCTGALFLGAAGLLRGYRATTHWNYKSILAMFPGVTVADGFPRFVIDANRVTGGGISSTMDESMAIVSLLLGPDAAKQGQLTIQYAPEPPFQSGDPSQADPVVMFEVSSNMHQGVSQTAAKFREYIEKWGSAEN